jgi:site-specific recombinase XerD
MSDELEPISPKEALTMWLDYLESDLADSSIDSYEYRLNPFVQWCEEHGIKNLNDFSPPNIRSEEV